MGIRERLHRAVDTLCTFKPIEDVDRRRFDAQFATGKGGNLYRGVFDTFEAAAATSPPTHPVGYDNQKAASLYEDRTRRIYPPDYPVLFWLTRIIGEGCRRVFDVGGHIGVGYYAYQRYLAYPPEMTWTVCDVPAVVAQGRALAKERDGLGQLHFTDRFEECAGADVLLGIGSLQYLPESLAARLGRVKPLPRHVIANLLPLHPTESFFTLQSMGVAYCPYRVTADATFVGDVTALGYRLIDRWTNPDKECRVAFDPEHSLDHYHGLYFRLD